MGNTHTEGHHFKICTAQCQRPLKFMYNFDKTATISPNQLIFRKFAAGKATAVADRILMQNEIICIRITVFHKGTFKFGVTSINPKNMSASEFEGMILNNPNALIMRLLSNKCVKKDNILFFQYTSEGEVLFGWSKKGKIREKATLITGLQVGTPMWAVFEVIGKNIVFKLENDLIPLLASMPAEMMRERNIEMVHQSLENIPSEREKKTEERMRKTKSYNKLNQPESSSEQSSTRNAHFDTITDFSTFFKLPISTIEEKPYNKHNHSPPTHHHLPTTSIQTESKSPLNFHSSTGRNVSLSSDEASARRTTGTFNAYVFTARPIATEENISISLNTIDPTIKKGLGFGLTVCDPGTINEFPDDGDDLLDRGEYWVYVRDVLKNVSEREEVSFFLNRKGKVSMNRAGEEKTLVHVDTSLPLWIFFDLTGCVQHISSLGVSKRQAVKKESNFRNDQNFHRQSDRNTAIEDKYFHSKLQDLSSVDIAEPINLDRIDTRRKSENNLLIQISPKPSLNKNVNFSNAILENVHNLPPNTPPPVPTSTRPSNYFSKEVPVSLRDPLIPLPSRPPPVLSNHPKLKSSLSSPPPKPSRQNQSSTNLIENLPPSSNHPILLESTFKESEIENSARNNITTNISETSNTNENNLQPLSQTNNQLQQHDIEQLLQQIDSLKGPTNQPECSICLDLPPDCVLYTCGHMCLCHACANDVLNSPTPFCPICRNVIKDIVKIYRS